jgi:uncharacterized protein YqeY
VKATIAEMGKLSFGDLMRLLMPKFQGKADGKLVSQIVNKHLKG